jgi:TrmH family RNA methyltransferase
MITSTSNAQVKYLVNLSKKAKARREEKRFVVEGLRSFLEIPKDRLVKAYATEKFYDEHRELFTDIECEMVSETVFTHMSDTQTPQGVLAVASMKEYAMSDILECEDAFILACEDLQDPGNLGTILRAGEGAGVTGIILSKNTVDLYNPKVIRSTMGSVFRMPVVVADDFVQAVKMMKNKGIKVAAAHLAGTQDYAKTDYGKKCAFLIGNEGNGLTKAAACEADMLVKIPMKGQVESLNAAIAATVLMYDVAAKRRM